MRRIAAVLIATAAVVGFTTAAHAADPIGWDEHSVSYIANGEAVHPEHSHAPAVREPMPEWAPVEGETLVTVERIAGADRYETAVLINQLRDVMGVSFAFVVNGANPVDALPVAAADIGPVFYVPPTGDAPRYVLDELYHLQPDAIIVVGGPGAIDDGALASITVIRL